MGTKADPFRNKTRWEEWKRTLKLQPRFVEKPISEQNRKWIIDYLLDMEQGYNVNRKGRRSYIRLNTIRQRIVWVIANLEIDDITQATDRQVLEFFNRMTTGDIRRHDGKPFKSATDYIKVFTAFWHWYQKRDPRAPDITRFLTTDVPLHSEFVYFTVDELRQVAAQAKLSYRAMMWFLFDSGIRSPTELMSVRIRDLCFLPDHEVYKLHIREEYAKTFGRKIKLVLCSDILKEYIRGKGPDSALFSGDWNSIKTYLKRLFVRVLGDLPTKGGKRFGEIRPYDFRHSSACYWLTRYKKEAGFKYRFGWKENQMMHYYTNFLGMEDPITQQDIMLETEAKSVLEKELVQQKRANAILEERLRRLESMVLQDAIKEANERVE